MAAPFRIDRDGAWFYRGSAIERPEMVRLFAAVLKREAEGRYALVTPYERHEVAVEDAPFVAVALRAEGERQGRRLILTTNVGAEVAVGRDHPLIVRCGAAGDPRPYVALDDGLEAKLARPVYYELAALAEAGPADGSQPGVLGVWSAGVFFALDRDEPDDGAERAR